MQQCPGQDGCSDCDAAPAICFSGWPAGATICTPSTAVAWAREKSAEASVTAASRVDLQGYEDGMFNVLVDGHCFHRITGEDRRKFPESNRRVLQPGEHSSSPRCAESQVTGEAGPL